MAPASLSRRVAFTLAHKVIVYLDYVYQNSNLGVNTFRDSAKFIWFQWSRDGLRGRGCESHDKFAARLDGIGAPRAERR
jgi:hypothetical protein